MFDAAALFEIDAVLLSWARSSGRHRWFISFINFVFFPLIPESLLLLQLLPSRFPLPVHPLHHHFFLALRPQQLAHSRPRRSELKVGRLRRPPLGFWLQILLIERVQHCNLHASSDALLLPQFGKVEHGDGFFQLLLLLPLRLDLVRKLPIGKLSPRLPLRFQQFPLHLPLGKRILLLKVLPVVFPPVEERR